MNNSAKLLAVILKCMNLTMSLAWVCMCHHSQNTMCHFDVLLQICHGWISAEF
jgi:hypothetical protein